jgi:hypothetical protein
VSASVMMIIMTMLIIQIIVSTMSYVGNKVHIYVFRNVYSFGG